MIPDDHIRKVLRVKRGDSLPFTGWYKATRRDLARIYSDLGYKVGAEVGVRIGSFSEIMCQSNPGLEKLYCVDAWAAYERVTQEQADKCYQQAVDRLAKYPTEIIRKSSMEASKDFKDGSLDFVYIDAAHDFDNVMLDIILWARKVRVGGMVSGHDFFPFYRAGVMQAVFAYTQAHGIVDWYLTKEKEASWLWVKKR